MNPDDLRYLNAEDILFLRDRLMQIGNPTHNDARKLDAMESKIRSAKWFEKLGKR